MNRVSIATRRDFLTRGLGLVGVGAAIPNFLVRSALAAPENASSDRIVVSLLLTGGPDGLSLVPPYGHDEYYKQRKNVGIAVQDLIKLNDEVGLHPKLAGFKQMLDQGACGVVLGTGYPNFNLSHFVGRDIWESATMNMTTGSPGATGWLGRYVDATCQDRDPTLNVAVGPARMPLIVTGKEHPGVGFSSPDSFRFLGEPSEQGQTLYEKLNKMTGASAGELQFITETAVNANAASVKLAERAGEYRTPVTYPDTQFGNSVRTIASLINGGLPGRAYYAAQGIAVFGGYDTHAEQLRRLDLLLSELSETITAFYKDLSRCSNADRVLTFTFSEFGRRVPENYSGGTDHGLAQPMFLFGSGVKPGVHGKQPSLTDLDDRQNLKMQVDFRSVYAAILEKWLQTPSEPILQGKFEPTDCLA